MKTICAVVILLWSSAAAYGAEERAVLVGPRATHVKARTATNSGGGFSVDLPLIARIQGANSFFFTALDITNQSSQATDVSFEYISSDLGVDVVAELAGGLAPFVSFHQDDFLQFMVAQGLLTQRQADNAFGTLLVTFANSSFTLGREASVTARIYSFTGPSQMGTTGFEYRGQVVHTNGLHSVASIARNTSAAGSGAARLSTNVGIEDVGIDDAGRPDSSPVAVQLSFYDATSGIAIGPQPVLALHAGQVAQATDLWETYQLPLSTTDVIVVATEISGTAQIRGYVAITDIDTRDFSFFYMQ